MKHKRPLIIWDQMVEFYFLVGSAWKYISPYVQQTELLLKLKALQRLLSSLTSYHLRRVKLQLVETKTLLFRVEHKQGVHRSSSLGERFKCGAFNRTSSPGTAQIYNVNRRGKLLLSLPFLWKHSVSSPRVSRLWVNFLTKVLLVFAPFSCPGLSRLACHNAPGKAGLTTGSACLPTSTVTS